MGKGYKKYEQSLKTELFALTDLTDIIHPTSTANQLNTPGTTGHQRASTTGHQRASTTGHQRASTTGHQPPGTTGHQPASAGTNNVLTIQPKKQNSRSKRQLRRLCRQRRQDEARAAGQSCQPGIYDGRSNDGFGELAGMWTNYGNMNTASYRGAQEKPAPRQSQRQGQTQRPTHTQWPAGPGRGLKLSVETQRLLGIHVKPRR